MNPEPASRATAPHYRWASGSEGWRLLDTDALSVIEERVPPGDAETWHVHDEATQFFYVVEGSAVMHTTDGDVPLAAGSGVEVRPGLAHQFANVGDVDVRFLVISSPSTRDDRTNVDHDIPRSG